MACVFMLEQDNPPDLVNVGSGEEVSIQTLADKVKAATGCPAEIAWDTSKPDGTLRKLCDIALIRSLGWEPTIELDAGLTATVFEYRDALAASTIRL